MISVAAGAWHWWLSLQPLSLGGLCICRPRWNRGRGSGRGKGILLKGLPADLRKFDLILHEVSQPITGQDPPSCRPQLPSQRQHPKKISIRPNSRGIIRPNKRQHVARNVPFGKTRSGIREEIMPLAFEHFEFLDAAHRWIVTCEHVSR